jgi:hypothetical protein
VTQELLAVLQYDSGCCALPGSIVMLTRAAWPGRSVTWLKPTSRRPG